VSVDSVNCRSTGEFSGSFRGFQLTQKIGRSRSG